MLRAIGSSKTQNFGKREQSLEKSVLALSMEGFGWQYVEESIPWEARNAKYCLCGDVPEDSTLVDGELSFLRFKNERDANDVPEEEEDEHNSTEDGEDEAYEGIREVVR